MGILHKNFPYSDHIHFSDNGMVCFSDHHSNNGQNVRYSEHKVTSEHKIGCVTQPCDLNTWLVLLHYLNVSIIQRAIINILTAVTIWLPDMSGIQMVESSPIAKCSAIQMGSE